MPFSFPNKQWMKACFHIAPFIKYIFKLLDICKYIWETVFFFFLVLCFKFISLCMRLHFFLVFEKPIFLYISKWPIWGSVSDGACEELACHCRRLKRCGLNHWVRKIPWRRARQPTSVFLPGESHGQRSIVGYGPEDHKELDTTEVT